MLSEPAPVAVERKMQRGPMMPLPGELEPFSSSNSCSGAPHCSISHLTWLCGERLMMLRAGHNRAAMLDRNDPRQLSQQASLRREGDRGKPRWLCEICHCSFQAALM